MRHADLQALLTNTDADAWCSVEVDGPERWVLTDDARVSLRAVYDDERESFGEPWAMSGADPQAQRQDFDLCLNGETIIRHLFVTVDGGRCALPLAELSSYDEVTHERRWHLTDPQFRTGQLIAELRGQDFERYVRQCGLAVEGRPDFGEARVYTGGNGKRQ